ncbi:unnamed protein product [Microthlaspi erraticum]|uniref:Uncharacterized protein n=1 Tax=Microthlaspi erraticum TaxID=1685480 RepID=A0A6D2K0E7_9BRAS|nr:unnamed protein product [Microthlaspi erraticum]
MKLASWRRFAASNLFNLVNGNIGSMLWISAFMFLIMHKCDFQDVAAELKKLENLKADLEAQLKTVNTSITSARARLAVPEKKESSLIMQVMKFLCTSSQRKKS